MKLNFSCLDLAVFLIVEISMFQDFATKLLSVFIKNEKCSKNKNLLILLFAGINSFFMGF